MVRLLRLLNRWSVFGDGFVELCLSRSMPYQLREMVAMGLAPMTAAGFLKDYSEEVLDDVRKHVLDVDRLRVILAKGEGDNLQPVAFAASNVKMVPDHVRDSSKLLHLGGIIVAPSYQGLGIGKKLIESEIDTVRAQLIGGHTANQIMLSEFERVSSYELVLANMLFEVIGTPEIKKQQLEGTPYLTHVGRYPQGGLYGDMKKFQQKGMQIARLNTINGDAVIYTGRVS